MGTYTRWDPHPWRTSACHPPVPSTGHPSPHDSPHYLQVSPHSPASHSSSPAPATPPPSLGPTSPYSPHPPPPSFLLGRARCGLISSSIRRRASLFSCLSFASRRESFCSREDAAIFPPRTNNKQTAQYACAEKTASRFCACVARLTGDNLTSPGLRLTAGTAHAYRIPRFLSALAQKALRLEATTHARFFGESIGTAHA